MAEGVSGTGARGEQAAEQRLDELREAIARLDGELLDLLAQRLSYALEIGNVKRELGIPVLDPAREAEVVRRGAELARERGLDPELARDILWRLIAHSRTMQEPRRRSS